MKIIVQQIKTGKKTLKKNENLHEGVFHVRENTESIFTLESLRLPKTYRVMEQKCICSLYGLFLIIKLSSMEYINISITFSTDVTDIKYKTITK
jgi:hypothetical protein